MTGRYESFGKMIEKIRESTRMSREDLAAAVNSHLDSSARIGAAAIGYYERQERCPDLDVLRALRLALRLTPPEEVVFHDLAAQAEEERRRKAAVDRAARAAAQAAE